MSGTAAGIAALTLAYPRADFPEQTVELYARMLADLGDQEVTAAIERLIKRSRFLPTIAEIRLEVSEARRGLPTPSEAWEIATRGTLGGAPPELIAAIEACGGRWSMIHSESPEVMRAQFTKDYAARRDRAILIDAGAVVVTDGVAEMLPARRAERMLEAAREIPETTQLAPRPVMLRMMRRHAGRELEAPTPLEAADALQVVEAGPLPDLGDGEDPLYVEAQRILTEVDADAA